MTHTPQPETSRLLSAIQFADPVSAGRNIARVQERLGGATYDALLHILAASPDPDSVVILLGRFLEEPSGVVVATLTRDPILLHHACLIFGHSKWLGETLIQNIDLLKRFGRHPPTDRCLSREEYREEFARFQARSMGRDLSLSLARFRKREYVRILLRDVSGTAAMAEITEEISALSDALLQEAAVAVHAGLARRYGAPRCVDIEGRQHECRFAVLSLGKLGGNELNYSSDVDLLFLFDGDHEPPEAPITNREYFIQLAQQTTEILSRRTPEGQVFRIDLRLRPRGHEGELAVALPRAVQYYAEVAQDWELQAMIKARHCTGDLNLSREFIAAIAAFVYRPNLNFAAIKTALQSRENIDRRGRKGLSKEKPGHAIDVKLDRGGIRDIEFLVQCLQRVYGGEEKWLRSRGTLFALHKLHDKGHISGNDHHNLTKAYEFLRNLEHHLQLRHGRQVHQLPTDEAELTVLAKCLQARETTIQPQSFIDEVRARMGAVAAIYRRVVFQEQSTESPGEDDLRTDLGDHRSPDNSDSPITQRLAVDAPHLLSLLSKTDLSLHARRNLDQFLKSATTSSGRYRAIMGSSRAFERALEIFECSEYLTDSLMRYPTDLGLLETGVTDRVDSLCTMKVESCMDPQRAQTILRQQFRRSIFRASVCDIFSRGDIWELLAEYSDAADRALGDSLQSAGCPAGFAVMALGRLGSCEFDVLSDADLLFVADESSDLVECRRVAERVVALLTAYTNDGRAFPIDTRLRPEGTQGELVTTCSRLTRYFSQEARPWEAISYLRLRFVSGDEEIGERVLQLVQEGIGEIARNSRFAADLAEMRQRLDETGRTANFKTGPGGTYDIEFLLGRLQAENTVWATGNFCTRIAALQLCGLLLPGHASELSENASFLRSLEHYVRLVTGRAAKWLRAGDHAQSCVAKLLSIPSVDSAELANKLDTVLHRTREIYLQYHF